MTIRVYFREPDTRKLASFNVDGVDNPAEAITAVIESLRNSGERFTPPVLAVVQGGKV